MASLVLAVCVGSLLGIWQYAYSTYLKTNEISQAGQLARAAIEEAKVRGFLYYPTGQVINVSTSTTPATGRYTAPSVYYTRTWAVTNDTAAAKYRLDVRVDDWDVAPADGGTGYSLMRTTKRTFIARVHLQSDGQTLSSMGTILVRSGI
jgi:hypothetical protein